MDSQWTRRVMQVMPHKKKIILKIVVIQGGVCLLEEKVKLHHIAR